MDVVFLGYHSQEDRVLRYASCYPDIIISSAPVTLKNALVQI